MYLATVIAVYFGGVAGEGKEPFAKIPFSIVDLKSYDEDEKIKLSNTFPDFYNSPKQYNYVAENCIFKFKKLGFYTTCQNNVKIALIIVSSDSS